MDVQGISDAGEHVFLNRFQAQVCSKPEQIAIHHGNTAITYAQLAEAVEDMAGRLEAAGVRHGDHIAVLLDNDLRYPALLLAALKVGAVLVPFSPVLAPLARLSFSSG